MIAASLSDSRFYEELHPRFRQAFEYVKNHDLSKEPAGKVEIDGDNLFINIAEITGKTPDAALVEVHKKYMDIQLPLTSPETMGWIDAKACTHLKEEYSEQKEMALFTDKPTAYITVAPGEFAIFFPHDGHAPGIGQGTMKKAIVKVLI